MDLEINDLTISSGTFFTCPESDDPSLFTINNLQNSINIANLAITNIRNCKNLKIFNIISALNLVLTNLLIENS